MYPARFFATSPTAVVPVRPISEPDLSRVGRQPTKAAEGAEEAGLEGLEDGWIDLGLSDTGDETWRPSSPEAFLTGGHAAAHYLIPPAFSPTLGSKLALSKDGIATSSFGTTPSAPSVEDESTPDTSLSRIAMGGPIASALWASVATATYHVLATGVRHHNGASPIKARYGLMEGHPMAGLVGTAMGSLWGLYRLTHTNAGASHARNNCASACVSALATSFCLVTLGSGPLMQSVGYAFLDLAHPAAHIYFAGGIGLVYNLDWRSLCQSVQEMRTARPERLARIGSADSLALSDISAASSSGQPQC